MNTWGNTKGWVVWFCYACGPPLFFFIWWFLVKLREEPRLYVWCKRWHRSSKC